MLSAAYVHGVLAALLAAVLYGIAPVIQASAARQARPGGGLGLGLLLRLTMRPLWLAGLAAEALSFLVEVYAFSKAPVVLVAPIMAFDMVVFALLARRTLGERLSRPGRAGIAAMTGGIALLAVTFHTDGAVGVLASDDQMLAFGVCGLLFTAVGTVAANLATRRRMVAQAALIFGLSAGVCYALATLATRQIGLVLRDHQLTHLMTTPTPYVLVVFSVLALSLEQRGLQDRAAVVAFPVTSGVSAFLPVVLGLVLLGEQTPGGAQMVAFVVSLVLVAAGVVGLGHDRAAGIARESAAADAAAASGEAAGPDIGRASPVVTVTAVVEVAGGGAAHGVVKRRG